jgi:hypothetical protein
MTDDATDSLLPPMAWLRMSGWGRDVVRYTRDPQAELPNDVSWGFATAVYHDPVDASVLRARYERILGGLDYARIMSLRNSTIAEAIPLFLGSTREMEMAREVAAHAISDHVTVAIGPELGAEHRADPTSDLPMSDVRRLARIVYVIAEDNGTLSCDGKPLHGILVASEQIGDVRYLSMTPMSRDLPNLNAQSGYADVIVLPEEDDVTISQGIHAQFDEILANCTGSDDVADQVLAADEKEGVPVRAGAIARIAERRLTIDQIEMCRPHVEAWARIVGGALRCMSGEGPAAVAAWQNGAPEADVARSDAGGTGAKKAEQRLRAGGWLRIRRYEKGQTANAATPAPMPAPITIVREEPETISDRTPVPAMKRERPVPPRRLRRMRRNAENAPKDRSDAQKTSSDATVTTPDTQAMAALADEIASAAPETPAAEVVQDEETVMQGPVVPVEDPELLPVVDQANRAAFKDLPPLDHRNWETTVPPALASMVIRRAKVDQMTRETDDATRRRLAADLLPRLKGAPDLLKRLQLEKDANPSLRRAFALGPASMMRDVDDEVARDILHPVHAVVEDDALTETLLFPGVRRHPNPMSKAVTLVTAWREGSILHLVGSIHEGCMIGFRRIEYDLDERSVEAFDSDADTLDEGDLLDRLWAPVADALLGPVDPWEQWRWERRERETSRSACGPAQTGELVNEGPCLPPATPMADVEPGEEAAYATWDTVSWPVSDRNVATSTRQLAETNAVARAIVVAVTAATDHMPAEVRAAAIRHLRSISASDEPRLEVLTSPDVDEDDLSTLPDGDGIIVVTDRALFEHASPGIAGIREPRRETPLCILYHLRRNGLAALILQVTPESRLNLAQWTRISLSPREGETDLAWYLRGAVAMSLRGGASEAEQPRQEITTGIALPAVEVPEAPRGLDPTPAQRREEESPRRIVAQARLRPVSLAAASAAASAWFDATAERHRLRIVSHQRAEGEWTIEHRSEDRLNPSIWSTTLRLAPDGESLDVLVRSTIQSGVKPRLPGLVRDIVEATPTYGPDGLLSVEPLVVETRSDLNRLLRDLQSPDRVLPILLMSEIKNGGGWMRDPRDVVRQSLGAMTVWLLPDRQTYEVSDALGQEYRTFDGAVRIFQPRFDADVDMPGRHPRIMMGTGADRSLGDLVSRATASTTTRYPIVDAPRQRPTAVERVVETPVAIRVPPAPTPPVARRFTPVTRPVIVDPPFGPPTPAETSNAPKVSLEKASTTRPSPSPVPVERPTPAPARQPVPTVPPEAPRPEPVAAPVEIDPARLAALVDEAVERRLAAILQEMKAAEPVRPDAAEEPRLDLDEPAPQPAAPTRDEIREMIAAAASTRPEPAAPAVLDIAPLTSAIAGLVGRMDAMLAARPPAAHAAPHAPEDADWSGERAQYEELLSEAGTRVSENQERADNAETQRDEALAEIQRLRAALSAHRRDDEATGVEQQAAWPDTLDDLADWLERNPLPNVAVSTKAWRGMRKVPFKDMERLCRTLQLLDGAYIDMRAGADGARERWEQGLQSLRLENKKQTQMGKSIRGGAEYSFQHDGQKWEMDFHIRGTESLHNDHGRLIRIYFAYDAKEGRVIIGHMPTHLTTIDS